MCCCCVFSCRYAGLKSLTDAQQHAASVALGGGRTSLVPGEDEGDPAAQSLSKL